ncbi:MAG: hypothetical protein EAX96_15160 [Candidatus Lokiarchaeota archaeon]|nr:hypothetical protein [Candidatus Lokiarchaeota archaeon]
MSAKSKSMKSKKGLDETLYEELILHAIEKEPRRPRTIVRIIKGVLSQNQVVQILNQLEKKNKVQRNSTKAWIKV